MKEEALSSVAKRVFDRRDQVWFVQESRHRSIEEMEWEVLLALNYQFFYRLIDDMEAAVCYRLLEFDFARMKSARARTCYVPFDRDIDVYH